MKIVFNGEWLCANVDFFFLLNFWATFSFKFLFSANSMFCPQCMKIFFILLKVQLFWPICNPSSLFCFGTIAITDRRGLDRILTLFICS